MGSTAESACVIPTRVKGILLAEQSATTFWTFVREFSPLWVYASFSRES